uniref:Uncharacterized protein n=1 Tax=Klebsiella pneumoniae TaxID=573 RepID=A0A2P1BNW9_KLEPN|nr:hypothetical protein [Klebsiella pneumoniae]
MLAGDIHHLSPHTALSTMTLSPPFLMDEDNYGGVDGDVNVDATTGKDIFTTGKDWSLFSVSKYVASFFAVGLFRYTARARSFSAATLAWVRLDCGGNGYEFTDVVLKLPSASCGNPAAAGFASLRSSFSFAFHLPAPSSYRYPTSWHYIEIQSLCPRTRLRAKRRPEELTALIPS